MNHLVKQSRASVLLCSNDRHTNVVLSQTFRPIEITDCPASSSSLDLFDLRYHTLVCGSQTAETYSSCGLSMEL